MLCALAWKLREDLRGTGVGVTLIAPSEVDSPYFENNLGSRERIPRAVALLGGGVTREPLARRGAGRPVESAPELAGGAEIESDVGTISQYTNAKATRVQTYLDLKEALEPTGRSKQAFTYRVKCWTRRCSGDAGKAQGRMGPSA